MTRAGIHDIAQIIADLKAIDKKHSLTMQDRGAEDPDIAFACSCDTQHAYDPLDHPDKHHQVHLASMRAAYVSERVKAAQADALETEAALIGGNSCCDECNAVAGMLRQRADLYRDGRI